MRSDRTSPRLNRHSAPSGALVLEQPPSLGIVHIGLGNFHRAHFAVHTAEAVAAAGGDWGIYAYS
ncbi:MAG: mannitol dehydrogenase family protein, partial [Actinobacteria bacterium]|nr:mannitol dehydrogenase family protein [Actinomycetota bacterium]